MNLSRLSRGELLLLIGFAALAFLGGGWLKQQAAGAPGDDAQGAALRALLRPGELQMISSTHCPHCTRARQWLATHQVPVVECFVEHDAACRRAWQRTGAQATPTFVLRERQVMLGLDVPGLLHRLEADRRQ